MNQLCRVPLDWKSSIARLSRPTICACSPAAGTVAPGGKQTVTLTIRAGVPEKLAETVLFELAHFEPVLVTISLEGVCAAIGLSLARAPDDAWATTLQEAYEFLVTHGTRLFATGNKKGQSASLCFVWVNLPPTYAQKQFVLLTTFLVF